MCICLTRSPLQLYFGMSDPAPVRIRGLHERAEDDDLERMTPAVRATLSEDAEDLAAARSRANEPNLRFENVLKDLKRRGKL